MYNKVILAGYLAKDPELRYTSQGTPVAIITIAVNTKTGKGDEVLFIDAVAFGKQAESVTQHLGKGSPVLVEGRLRERHHEGQERKKIEVITSVIRFLPKRENGTTPGSESPVPPEITETEPF